MTDSGTPPRAWGEPIARGVIRQQPEDFVVEELLGFEPSGAGEHLWLHLRKRDWNTQDLALWLSRSARLPLRAVGVSGLKDRLAVTSQWFSLHLPGKPDPEFVVAGEWPEGVECLQAVRHSRKLNRGTHRANRFRLAVRALRDGEDLEDRLKRVAEQGVPNYFGVQRFGRESRNSERGAAWLRGEGEAPRKQQMRGFWLSAVRSELFNAVLAERVRRGVWNRYLDGDICQPDGRRGLFHGNSAPPDVGDVADPETTGTCDGGDGAQAVLDTVARVARGEVHPTAPLPGMNPMMPCGESALLEQRVLAPFEREIAGLEREGVEAARRATRLPVRDLHWTLDRDTLVLTFDLPAGSFATTVLAELVRDDLDRTDGRDRG